MANLKDFINSDLAIIMNLGEFTEVHSINGKQYSIVVDNDQLMKRSKKEFDGLTVGELLFYIKTSDLGKRPEQGEPMQFDGRLMYVFDAREDQGLLEVILHQNRGG